MKPKWLYISLAIIPAIIGLKFAFFQSANEKNNLHGLNVQNGDLIFRRGRSVESQAVLLSDRKSSFSHVGMVYLENEIPYVIHAVPGENNGSPDFIKMEQLDEFLSPEKAADFAVYRSDFPMEQCTAAAQNALIYFRRKIVFDGNYNLQTSDRLYCTELVMKAYEQAIHQSLNLQTTHLKFLFRNMNVLLPGNIIENPHFFKIINN